MNNSEESRPETASNDGTWSVWRMDETGNKFLVREQLSREEAERLAEEFAARGHKQTYWAERQKS